MAKVTITLEDIDGQVTWTMKNEGPTPATFEEATSAQQYGYIAYCAVSDAASDMQPVKE